MAETAEIETFFEIDALCDAIPSTAKLIVLVGLPGCGKTTFQVGSVMHTQM